MSIIKAVFFDRDGTLIDDVGFLDSIQQVAVIPAMLTVCQTLQHAGYKLFIVTNQSGVARGYFDEASVQQVNTHIQKLLAEQGIIIEKCFYCPHHPTQGSNSVYTRACVCRKPNPGLLMQAAVEYAISLSHSIMIGDKESDVQADLLQDVRVFLCRIL